jgi:hypothetical protein
MSIRDRSGYVVFSEGDVGAAHVLAHELLDSGQIELGRQRLGRWLSGRSGAGSDWAHIQFHMAVFELGAGDWRAAYDRFVDELLPIATTSQDALTDAPALAWRLALSGAGRERLPWEALRENALSSLAQPTDPYVELHNLLALAGARDADGIDAWLDAHRAEESDSHPTKAASASGGVLVRMADALGAYTHKHYRRAASLLREVVPEVQLIGGSRAQNELFMELAARTAAA